MSLLVISLIASMLSCNPCDPCFRTYAEWCANEAVFEKALPERQRDPKVIESGRMSFLPIYCTIMRSAEHLVKCPNWTNPVGMSCPHAFWASVSGANILCKAKVYSVAVLPVPDLNSNTAGFYYLWTKRVRIELDITEIYWGAALLKAQSKGNRVIVRISSTDFYRSTGDARIPNIGDDVLFPLYLYQAGKSEPFYLSRPYYFFYTTGNETRLRDAYSNQTISWCIASHAIALIKSIGNNLRAKEGLGIID